MYLCCKCLTTMYLFDVLTPCIVSGDNKVFVVVVQSFQLLRTLDIFIYHSLIALIDTQMMCFHWSALNKQKKPTYILDSPVKLQWMSADSLHNYS